MPGQPLPFDRYAPSRDGRHEECSEYKAISPRCLPSPVVLLSNPFFSFCPEQALILSLTMLSQILSVRSCVVLCFLNLLLTSAFASHIARPLHRSQVLARNHVRHRASPEETSQLQTENLRLRGEYSEKLAERERMLQGLSSEKNPLSIRDETSLSRRQDVTMTGQISALQAENQKLQGMIADLELLINDLVQFIGSKYGQAATIASVPSAAGSTPVNSQSVLATQAPVGQGGSAQGAEPTNSPVVVASTPAPGQQSQGTPQQGQSYAPTAVVPLTSLLSNLSTVPSLSAIPTSSSSSSSIAQTQSSASLTNDSVASSGSFDPMSSRNIAVYYGQTPVTSQVSLSTVCQDVSIDIVVLAFVNNLFSGGGYPSVNFGPYCNNGPTAAQSAAGATGLLDCSDLASQITTCQGLGKKVLLSLGGAISTSSIPDAASAQSLATNLWNLFAGGTSDLRPFGNSVSVDGFDIGKPGRPIQRLLGPKVNLPFR